MFRRKQPPELILSTAAYGRWLRAQRPQPIAWFLGQSDEDQEGLALLGDEYASDLCVAVGLAVADPVAANAGLDAATNLSSEEDLIRRVASDLAGKVGVDLMQHLTGTASEQPKPDPGEPLSMGGITERRSEDSDESDAAEAPRVFMGMESGIPMVDYDRTEVGPA